MSGFPCAEACGGRVGRRCTSRPATCASATLPATRAAAASSSPDRAAAIERLVRPEIGADRLALAYAVTVHRSQGSTVERAHALEDGGGRELAYVKMSRAKERSTVYVVADSMAQAKEDLAREWGTDRRLGWVIDTGTPITNPLAAELSPTVARPMRDGLRRGRMQASAKRSSLSLRPTPPPTPGRSAAASQAAA
jgi:hypothetical protein